jgi:hypothetical protein
MKSLIHILSGILLAATVGAAEPARFVALFDGQTFQGWEGSRKWFRIEGGAVVGGSLKEPVPRNEFLCTERQYTNFVLRLKFKLLGEGANAGVQIRSQRVPNHNEVSGFQADLGDPAWWGALYDESRRNRTLVQADPAVLKEILKRGDWNQYEIRCEGKRIRLAINGRQTVDYTERDEKIPEFGIIGLQIHAGPPTEAWYKEIEIQVLP